MLAQPRPGAIGPFELRYDAFDGCHFKRYPSDDGFVANFPAAMDELVRLKARSVWIPLELPSAAHLLPFLLESGFVVHHSQPHQLMLNKWIDPDTPNTLPLYAYTFTSAKVFVFDARGALLLITPFPFADAWDIPGGAVDPGETFANAAERETAEETAVHSHCAGILGFRHVFDGGFWDGSADLAAMSVALAVGSVPEGGIPVIEETSADGVMCGAAEVTDVHDVPFHRRSKFPRASPQEGEVVRVRWATVEDCVAAAAGRRLRAQAVQPLQHALREISQVVVEAVGRGEGKTAGRGGLPVGPLGPPKIEDDVVVADEVDRSAHCFVPIPNGVVPVVQEELLRRGLLMKTVTVGLPWYKGVVVERPLHVAPGVKVWEKGQVE